MAKVFTLAEVSEHKTSKDCWLIIGGKVQFWMFCYQDFAAFFWFDTFDAFDAGCGAFDAGCVKDSILIVS